ncbi:MAG: hypothetical protein ACW99Q_14810 [Candidatus Kariarchaeaceae archaeon]
MTIRYAGILKFFLIIGIMIILTGLAYFLGIFEIDFEYSLLGAPINSLYGITYLTLYSFGLYLVFFALLLILPTLDKNRRNGLKRYRRLLISVEIFGLILILYSRLVNLGILPTMNLNYNWLDYFIIGSMISVITYLIIIFSTENFQDLSKYKWVWILLIIVGIYTELLSLLTYWSLLLTLGIPAKSWGDLFLFGIVFLLLGGFPFLLSYKPTHQRISLSLGVLSLILIMSGLLTYLVPTLAVNGVLFPLSIFKYNNYFDYLFFGALLLIMGVSIASYLEEFQNFFKRFPVLWFTLLFLGFLQYFVSILMEITNTYFIDLGLDFLFLESTRGSLLFGMTWNVFFINGFITTVSVLIILSSIILKESNSKQEIQVPEAE